MKARVLDGKRNKFLFDQEAGGAPAEPQRGRLQAACFGRMRPEFGTRGKFYHVVGAAQGCGAKSFQEFSAV